MSHRNVVALFVSYVFVGVAIADARVPHTQPVAVIEITITAETHPVPQAQVIVSGKTAQTDANGRLTLQVVPGPIEITVVKEGFNPVTMTVTAIAGQSQAI